jgi:protein-S-isoprenylcysteine O-methyltransferase Ste14
MAAMQRTGGDPWWKGRRGEWYVVAQVGLFALVALGPRSWPAAPPWPPGLASSARVVGAMAILAGTALAVGALLRLGSSLTALPYPKDDAVLVVTGPYRIVRNPIYSGLILAALGWGLWVNGPLTLFYAVLLFAFFDVKSRLEERWLAEKYPGYTDYQRRVRKLIPWVY